MRDIFQDHRIEKIIQSNVSRDEKLLSICKMLAAEVAYFNWIGFYLADHEKKELVLGPYVGAPTEHIRIPFGRGVCGQAAVTQETIIVRDIAEESNYLSCSVDVKSEIVVPIFKNDRFVAELDIDSHAVNPFGDDDKNTLEVICQQISDLF